jgi:predicted amidohydrolase
MLDIALIINKNPNMQNLRLTIIQPDIHWHSVSDNITNIESLTQGLNGRSDLIILPEMFSTGFTMDTEKFAEEMDGETVSAMRRWSTVLNAHVAGSIIIRENGRFFNRVIVTSPDGNVYVYDKRHLFRMGGEDKKYTGGKENITVGIKGWRVRPFICYDLRFPVWSRNSADGYDLAFFCANWPAVRENHWETLLRARAIENQCYVAGVNRTGVDGRRIKYNGGSCVIGFRGEELYSAGVEPSIYTVEIQYEALLDYRKEFPAWMDADDFRIMT